MACLDLIELPTQGVPAWNARRDRALAKCEALRLARNTGPAMVLMRNRPPTP